MHAWVDDARSARRGSGQAKDYGPIVGMILAGGYRSHGFATPAQIARPPRRLTARSDAERPSRFQRELAERSVCRFAPIRSRARKSG